MHALELSALYTYSCSDFEKSV